MSLPLPQDLELVMQYKSLREYITSNQPATKVCRECFDEYEPLEDDDGFCSEYCMNVWADAVMAEQQAEDYLREGQDDE